MKIVKVQLRGLSSVKSFVNILTRYECDFDIIDQRYVVDAKSIMGLFSLDLLHPLDLKIHSEDEELIKKVTDELEMYNYISK